MTRSRQQITSSEAKTVSQLSDASNAMQSVDHVRAESIEQEVKSAIDFATLTSELATLRAAMREAAATPDHDDALGEVAAAEKAAGRRDEAATFRHLKAAGKWALETSEKVGVGVAIAAIKYALGI
jgi:hypothetical protein